MRVKILDHKSISKGIETDGILNFMDFDFKKML